MTAGETLSANRPSAGVTRRRESFWVRARSKRRDLPKWQQTIILLVVLFCLAVLIRTFMVQAYYVPSGAMENTVQNGDRVLVNKVSYDFRDPHRGEVVVFRGPSAWTPENLSDANAGMFSNIGSTLGDMVGVSQLSTNEYIKRVIGLPGDTVACCDADGRVTVNGVGVVEPYVTQNAPIADTAPNPGNCSVRNFHPVVVPPGMLYVLGDQRVSSRDSRCEGTVPIANVIGRAEMVMWPGSHWSTLSVPAGFNAIPKPEAGARPARVPVTSAGDAIPALPGVGALVIGWARRRRRRTAR